MSERVVTNLYTSVIFTFVLLLIPSLEYCFAGKGKNCRNNEHRALWSTGTGALEFEQ